MAQPEGDEVIVMKPTPEEALKMYLDSRENEVADATLQSTEYRLNHFVRWCDEKGIEDIAELTREHLKDYRTWRREDRDLAPRSEETQMDTLRGFVEWTSDIGIAEEGIEDAVRSPDTSESSLRKSDIVETEKADQILKNLDRYSFASREHIIFLLLWETGARTGGLRTLDLEDYDENSLKFEHEPERGTPLKNGRSGERFVSLSGDTAAILDEYIENNRKDTTDVHGRNSLITTHNGRVAASTVRGTIYRLTRPCTYGSCPVTREEPECTPANNSTYASRCPKTTAPHSIRRGAITRMLRNNVPKEIVSERCDVTTEVMEKHYDERDLEEKMERRRDYFED